jgi:branched-chain amino acid transport system permease protein
MSRSRAMLLAAVVLVALAPFLLKSYGTYLLTLWCVYVMAGMGLNLTTGYAGQMSIGHAAFLGIGAYTGAIILKAGLGLVVALPAATLLCFVIGIALGFPALRVQHHYLAFATLGFNVLVFLVMRNEEWLTGGTFGMPGIPRPAFFGLSLDRPYAFFLFTYASALLLAGAFYALVRSPWGRAFATLRDNRIRAESLGVDVTAYTLLAFAIGAAFAGIAGVYFAMLLQFIEPAPFHPAASLMLLLAVIIGGAGRFLGPVVGAAFLVLLPEWLRFMKDWYLVLFGLAIILLMIWLPGGALSALDRLKGGGRWRHSSR